MLDPPPSTLALAEWAERLGQPLFFPPSVFGWPGGRGWLTAHTMIARANFVDALIGGKLHRPRQPFNARALAEKHGFETESAQRQFFCQLLLGMEDVPGEFAGETSIDEFVRLLCLSPYAQLT